MSETIEEAAARIAALGDSAPRLARDPVNLPMIRNWAEAIGGSAWDEDVAPPAMIQVWTMPGLHGVRTDDDPLGLIVGVLDEAGYTSTVATNCDQEYHRYLKVGEQLAVRGRLLDVTGPKKTGLGEGWFVNTRSTWYSGDEQVAAMDFRVLKFRPPSVAGAAAPVSAAAAPMLPLVSPDTAFFWAGTAAGELRIQRCTACGALRHPPGAMCPSCGSGDLGYVVAAGTGTIYSYVVHHHPPVPGKTLPIVIALVELAEGVRMVGELAGVSPEEVAVGMPVAVSYASVREGVTLPVWRPAGADWLPALIVPVTPTVVISTALATQDFYVAHHDRDAAIALGSKDIFLNILTTTGLVQRYVSSWAPDAVIRGVSIRLGVPCYAGDSLTFTGRAHGDSVSVVGACSLGNHVTATVRIAR
ncbi:MAG TPA: OB-fold domain-containing protein [Streptosporangiaceae bacterium]|nr:OB-fold domain-containing protein [Streptosporangiaceae bacterium]